MDNMMLQRDRLMQYQMQKHAETVSPALQERNRLRQERAQADYERQAQDETEAKHNYRKSFEKEVQGEFVGPKRFQPVVNGIDHTMVYNLDGSNSVVPIAGALDNPHTIARPMHAGNVMQGAAKSVTVSHSKESLSHVTPGRAMDAEHNTVASDKKSLASVSTQPDVADTKPVMDNVKVDLGVSEAPKSLQRKMPDAVAAMSTDFDADYSAKRGVPNAMGSISNEGSEASAGFDY